MRGLNILITNSLTNTRTLAFFSCRSTILFVHLFRNNPRIIRKLWKVLVTVITLFKNATTTIIDLQIFFAAGNRTEVVYTVNEI